MNLINRILDLPMVQIFIDYYCFWITLLIILLLILLAINNKK